MCTKCHAHDEFPVFCAPDFQIIRREGHSLEREREAGLLRNGLDRATSLMAAHRVVDAVNELIQILRQLHSPVDCAENVPCFRQFLDQLDVRLVWGRKASHKYDHAFVQKYAPEVGSYYTIWTNLPFSQIDLDYPWESHDLFGD